VFVNTRNDSKRASATDDSEQYNNDGDNQKNVDKTAKGIGRDQPKKPQDDQNHCNRIEHDKYPFCSASDVHIDHLKRAHSDDDYFVQTAECA